MIMLGEFHRNKKQQPNLDRLSLYTVSESLEVYGRPFGPSTLSTQTRLVGKQFQKNGQLFVET